MEADPASPHAKVTAETPDMGPARLWYAAIAFGVAAVILVGSVAVSGVDGTFNVNSPDFGGVAPTIAALFALVGLIYLASGVLHTLRVRAFGTNGVASGATGPDSRIDWVLDVKAPLRGLDYVAEFPVKVSGRTLADGPTSKRGEEPFAGFRAPPSRWSLILLLALLLFGGALSVAGAFALAKQINLSTVAGFVLGIVLLVLAWVTWRRRSA